MAGPLLSTAVAAAAIALAGKVAGAQPALVPASPFGGSRPVTVAHVGRIEVDLEPAGAGRLERVSCAGISGRATGCYVSR